MAKRETDRARFGTTARTAGPAEAARPNNAEGGPFGTAARDDVFRPTSHRALARKKTSPDDDAAAKPAKRRKPRRKPVEPAVEERPAPARVGLWTLAALASLSGWFAPQVIVGHVARDAVLRACLPSDAFRATAGSASVGWVSPVVLRDLEVVGPEGSRLTVRAAKSSRTLAGLVAAVCCGGSGYDVGTVVLDGPTLTVTEARQGDPASGLASDGSAPMAIPSGRIVVRDGRVTFEGGDDPVTFRDVAVDYAWDRGAWTPTALAAGLSVADAGENRLAVDFREAGEDDSTAARVTAEHLPLVALRPLAALTGSALEFDGTLDADVRISGEEQFRGRGKASLANFVCRGFDGDRRFVTTRATVSGAFDADGRRVRVTDAACETDFGSADVSFAVPTGRLRHDPLGVATWLAATYRVEADLDLAALSAATRSLGASAPPLRDGRATVRLDATRSAEESRWRAKVDVVNVARDGGGPIGPFGLDADVGLRAEGFDVRRLTCRSDFLTLDGDGTPRRATVRGRLDLGRFDGELAAMLGLEPGGDRGTFDFNVAATTDDLAGGTVEVEARVDGSDISLRRGGIGLEERRAAARGSCAVVMSDRQPAALKSAAVRLTVGDEEVSADLLEPYDLRSETAAASLAVTAAGDAGDLGALAARITGTTPPIERLGGSTRARGEVAIAADVVTLRGLDATVERFAADFAGVSPRERRVRLTGGLTFDRATGRVATDDLLWRSDSLSFRVRNASVVPGGDGPTGAADLAFRGGLAPVSRWFVPAPDATRPAGTFEGRGRLVAGDGFADVEAEATIKTPSLISGGRETWRAATGRVRTNARYGFADDRLRLATAEVGAGPQSVSLAGVVEQVSTRAVADLTGNATLDAASLPTGGTVTLAGVTSHPLTIKGPLLPPAGRTVDPALTITGGLGWASGSAGGLPLGPATLPVKLSGGVATISETAVASSSGTLRVGGTIELDGPRVVVRFPTGRVAENVRVTPAANAWLLRATPLLAGTTVDGAVSLDVTSAALPADRPELIASQSRLHVHGLTGAPGGPAAALYGVVSQIERVVDLADGGNTPALIGSAAGLAGQLLGVTPNGATGGPVPTMTVPEQTVAVTTRSGVITHDRLLVRFGDSIEVTTSGRVATDGRIDLVAAVPVLDRWVGDNGLPESLRGQTLRVPIGGTLENPRVDGRVVAELLRSTGAGRIENELRGRIREEAGGAVDDAVGNLIDRGLRGLFR